MNKEGFQKSLFNSQDSYPSPKDQTFSSSHINKYSNKTTEKLYEILDFFDKQPKNIISYQKDPFHSIKLKSSRPLQELKNQFVDPHTIVSKAKIKYDHEKFVKTTPSIVSEENDIHVTNSHRPKNLICIKKGNLEKYRPKYFQNEQLLAFMKSKSPNLPNLNTNSFSKTSSRNTLLITESSKVYNENKRINDFYCTLTNSKSKFLSKLISKSVPNFASIISEAFPLLSDSLSPVIFNEQESFKINENKQIIFFNKILDLLIVKFDEMLPGKDFNTLSENLAKMISIFDSIFQDFCTHMEVTSMQRSNFCKKIWKKHQEYYQKANENLVKYHLDINTELKVFSEKLKDENDSLIKKLNKIEEEYDKLQKRFSDLCEENKQLKQNLCRKEVELQESINRHEEKVVEEKEFIKDLEELVSTNNIDKILKKERKNEYVKILNILKNFQWRNLGSRIERKNTIAYKTFNTIDKCSNTPSLEVNQILNNRNTRINYLGQKYFGIKPAEKPDKLVKIENGKKEKENCFEFRRKKILEENILNQYKPQYIKSKSVLTDNNNLQFKLYLNKGLDFMKESVKDVYTQTEGLDINLTEQSIQNNIQSFVSSISSSINKALERLNISLDYIQNNNKFEEIGLNLEEFCTKLKDLDRILSEPQEISHENKVVIRTINETKEVVIKLKERNDVFFNEMDKVIHECDEVINNNDKIVESFDQIKEKQENLVESYQEISRLIIKGYTNVKSKIEKYLLDKENINSFTFSNLARELFDKNDEVIGEDKDLRMMLVPSLQPSQIRNKLVKNPKKVEKSLGTLKKNELLMIPEEDLSTSQSLIVESLRSQMNIKSTLSKKKLLKIINFIYFEVLSKIYFKNEEDWFEEPFIDPSELSYIYFNSLFGVEKISVRKYVEFLLTCFSHNKEVKRVQLFTKYFLKTQNKTFLFDKKNNHNFIQKNIILFILLLKEMDETEKVIFQVEEKENIELYLLSNKVHRVFEEILVKYPVSSGLKDKISSFFIENKKNFTKNLKQYSVMDFDSVLEFVCEVFEEIKQSIENYIKIIFKALTLEKIEGKVGKFDFMICFTVLFNKNKYSFEELENEMEKFKSDEGLTLNQFKHFILTRNIFNIKDFKELLYLDRNKINDLYIKLYNEITLNNYLTDILTRRVNVLKNNPCSKSLNKKIKAFSSKVSSENQAINEENMMIRWLCFRFLDIVTFQIYNDARLHSICNPISDIIDDFSKIFGEYNNNKNLLFSYVLSRENNL